jgi:osmotically-inducible protein OsmY
MGAGSAIVDPPRRDGQDAFRRRGSGTVVARARHQADSTVREEGDVTRCEEPLGGGVGASGGDSGGGIPLPPVTDQDLIDAVRQAFFLDPILPENVCEIDASRGSVYLRGLVPSSDLRQRAVHVASQVQGVNRVYDETRVVGE